MTLADKQILVVGAASALGHVIANQFVQLGAKVVLVDNPRLSLSGDMTNGGGGKINVSYNFNFYENGEIESHLQHIVENCGSFHGLVYCGGIGGVRPLSLTRLPFINEMMNANLYSFIEIARCITKKGGFVKGGSIVAVSSVSSVKGLKAKTAYSASKAALDAAVRCLAAELSDKKIRVNSILKGWIASDMEADYLKSNIEISGKCDIQRQVLGIIDPLEVANTAAFLISDATRTITGTSLLLDGGYTL